MKSSELLRCGRQTETMACWCTLRPYGGSSAPQGLAEGAKGHWDELCAGKYDWAHLAMHLWPERVVPKCATDRSLAIAHGLEDVFWVEGADGKWKPRPTPTRSVEELVRERTSPAVKAALKSLLEAPVPHRGDGRARTRSSSGVRCCRLRRPADASAARLRRQAARREAEEQEARRLVRRASRVRAVRRRGARWRTKRAASRCP